MDFLLEFFKNTHVEIITVIITLLTTFLSTILTLKRINFNLLNEKKSKTARVEMLKQLNSNIKESITTLSKNTDVQDNKNDENSDNSNSTIIEETVTYINTNLKELYEKRNFDTNLKKISCILAIVMSIVGTAILFIGLIICLFTTEKIGWITTASGAIVEIVASIYFWLVNRTMKEVKENSKLLEKREDLIMAIELVEKIDDTKIKNETYKNVVENLISKN